MSLTVQHQISHQTRYDRFPLVFQQAKAIFPAPKRILSLGCSTGEECFALTEKYFPDAHIVGVDIDAGSIEMAKGNNQTPDGKILHENVTFLDSLNEAGSFDLVFCVMLFFSIYGDYSFAKFNRAIHELDEHVRRGGLIVIRTAQYDFMKTGTASRYHPILHGTHVHQRSGKTFHDGYFRKKKIIL